MKAEVTASAKQIVKIFLVFVFMSNLSERSCTLAGSRLGGLGHYSAQSKPVMRIETQKSMLFFPIRPESYHRTQSAWKIPHP
jgi:hypothetical protein